jgi:hypothetical protein
LAMTVLRLDPNISASMQDLVYHREKKRGA